MNRPAPLGLEPSFGYGDRLGLATPGHIRAHLQTGGPVRAVFAQQSVRELERTRRSCAAVAEAAQAAVDAAGFAQPWGADADHLKEFGDIEAFVAAGYSFFTIDPSDHVVAEADSMDRDQLRLAFAEIRDQVPWIEEFEGVEADLGEGVRISIGPEGLARCAVKYGRAVNFSLEMATAIDRSCRAASLGYEIEVSVDETTRPTTLAEHWIVASRLLDSGVGLAALAPRYVGGFEKGIDYIGDPLEFERDANAHARVAQVLGPYKLSLHSGSDKLSIYPGFARATGGAFHVKTAGTSYLEALRVIAATDSALFGRVIGAARRHFARDRDTYHLSIGLDDAPPPEQVTAAELADAYLDRDAGRQIAHVTFGSILTDPQLGPLVKGQVECESELYGDFLERHFNRHLTALNP
ncbi:MAG: tagaturonate epimerase family protein [Chloroflexota bacterium]|nr:tagaturonate epimerase family protein [Chloroflexota bacterium]MDE2936205.1 tagaturonate epimerase family protein [Chloroflexota bacterium]